ncbi:MAG TPA: hypothetical protein VGJ13_19900 [Pseudonocardiaceae bacterium]
MPLNLTGLPAWYVHLTDAHEAEMQRLLAERDTAAEVLLEHAPVFREALVCVECSETYPCAALRAVHDGRGVWPADARQLAGVEHGQGLAPKR